jgi:hypothetical protein
MPKARTKSPLNKHCLHLLKKGGPWASLFR